MTRVVLALSPHLDDAAFSCGGTLATLADAGHRVIVATVFTRSVPNSQGFALACQLDKGLPVAIDYMALRRDEDAAAMRILGAEPVWLDLLEAPHRGYASAPELFAGRRKDDNVVELLMPLLRALFAQTTPALILAPRAVGDHVDHHALRDALRPLGTPTPIAWWTDYPYALNTTRDDTGLHTVRPSAASLARKIAASCAYASQIGFQFGGSGRLQQALDAHPEEFFDTDTVGAKLFADLLPALVGA